MTKDKILEVVAGYRMVFLYLEIPKVKMDPEKTLGELTSYERLAHAHWLLDGIEKFAKDPSKAGKTGRHLASVQMIFSFEGLYTLEELMNHNRPDPGPGRLFFRFI